MSSKSGRTFPVVSSQLSSSHIGQFSNIVTPSVNPALSFSLSATFTAPHTAMTNINIGGADGDLFIVDELGRHKHPVFLP